MIIKYSYFMSGYLFEEKDACIPIFIEAIAKIWKQRKCLSMDEWIKMMWYIYTMEFYLSIRNGNVVICENMDEP